MQARVEPARLLNVRGCYFGAFVDGRQNLEAFERMAGRNVAAHLTFRDYTEGFPTAEYRGLADRRTLSCVTHEAWDRNPDHNRTYSLDNILRGDFDAHIEGYARSIRDLGFPFLHRPFHEMNSFWYPWSGEPNGGSEGAKKLIAAWQHDFEIFQSTGAHNAIWCWNPNKDSVPNEPWNDVLKFYPGDEYVHVIGFDAYNWGNTQSWGSTWQSFDELFAGIYERFSSRLPGKPMMIGEFASTESGGDKAQWIFDAFGSIRKNYPLIKLFNWFNINKELDWRINSSPQSLEAFRQAIADPHFLDHLRGY